MSGFRLSRRRAAAVMAAMGCSSSVWGHPGKAQLAPPVTAIAFAPDGRWLVNGSQAGVALREVIAGTLAPARSDRSPSKPAIASGLEQIQHIVFSPDGSGLAIAGGTVGESGTVEVFDWPSGKLRQRLECHSDVVNQVRFSEDGSHVVTAAHDGVCGWFGVGGSRAKTRISDHSGPVSSVVILPGGTTAVSGSVDQTLRVWDIRQGQTIRTLHNHVREVNDVALRPGGLPLPMVASAGADRTVRFWQPTIGRMVRFVRLDAEPLALAWICGGAKLVAACRDAQVRVIDPAAANVTSVLPVAAAGSASTGQAGKEAEAESWLYAVAVDPLDECRCAFGGSDGFLSIQRFGNPPR